VLYARGGTGGNRTSSLVMPNAPANTGQGGDGSGEGGTGGNGGSGVVIVRYPIESA
jgi:hypothetical protein